MALSTEVDICIATFRRPRLLSRLLLSLMTQRLDNIVMRIIIIDNDGAESARPALAVLDACGATPHLREFIYDVEPEQSISLARNRALAHVRATRFAFVDDDQTVSSHWLASLLGCMERHQADVVFGPVLSELPTDAPAWAALCFRRPRHRTGAPVRHGGSGNVLVRSHAIGTARFDPAFGLTGGEDVEFFHRLHSAGRRLVWCDEAIAREPVPATRLNLAWLRRRGFRDGQSYARIFVKPCSPWWKLRWFIRKSAQLGAGLLAAPVLRGLSYGRYVALTVRLAQASGQLTVLFSEGYLEQDSVPGDR